MFACVCRRVTEADVKHAGVNGAVASDALVEVLGLDDKLCCGRCLKRIDEFVELAVWGASHESVGQPALTATPGLVVGHNQVHAG